MQRRGFFATLAAFFTALFAPATGPRLLTKAEKEAIVWDRAKFNAAIRQAGHKYLAKSA